MATPVNLIRVPKPKRSAYNPDRPLTRNLLLKAQVRHFAEAESHLASEHRTGIDVNSVLTEGEAADYIRRVTAAIHRTGGRTERVRTAT